MTYKLTYYKTVQMQVYMLMKALLRIIFAIISNQDKHIL